MKKSDIIISSIIKVKTEQKLDTGDNLINKGDISSEIETIEKICNYDYGVYVFDNLYNMYFAKYSNKFNVDSDYEFGDKSYLIVLLDGNEEEIERLGGRLLEEEELVEFFEKTSEKNMYYIFDSQENLNGFLKVILHGITFPIDIPMLYYNGCTYVDITNFGEENFTRISYIACEFLGKKIKDKYVGNKLKKLFANECG